MESISSLINMISLPIIYFAFKLKLNENMCNYCKKIGFDGYRYKCLECDNYYMCNSCFEKRRYNKSHEIGHKMVRFDEPDVLFGTRYKSYDINLCNFIKLYNEEIHKNISCKICNIAPIKGLRFKCDICIDFNMCQKCSYFSYGRHTKLHPILVICKTQSSRVDYDKIKLGKLLGYGAFGKVYLAEYNQKNVACKVIEADESSQENAQYDEIDPSYIRELDAYREIKSDNILKMLGCCTNKVRNQFVILTEYMEKGNLKDLIKNEPDLTFTIRFSIAANIASGMFKIHRIGFIHRDIRPANILIGANYVAKIGDMGIAKEANEKDTTQTKAGCIKYMPPEFYTRKYTQKLDVFTFGLTLNELFKGGHRIKNQKVIVTKKSQVIYDGLVARMIRSDPNDRPNSKLIDEMIYFIDSYVNKYLNENKKILSNNINEEKINQIFSIYFRKSIHIFPQKKKENFIQSNKENINRILTYFKRKLSDRESLYPKDTSILFYLENICCIYYLEKDHEKCLEFLKIYMEKTEELFPGNTVEKAKSLSRAGFIHLFLIEDYQKAGEFYMKALEIRKKCLSEEDSLIANTYYGLGQCYQRLNLIQQSLEAFFKALRLRRKIYEEKSEFIVDTLSCISECYLKLNDSAQYTKYRREALEIKKSLFAAENTNGEYKEVLKIRGKDKGRHVWHCVLIEDERKFEQKMGVDLDIIDYGKLLDSGFGEDIPAYESEELKRNYGVKYSSKFDEYSVNGNLVKDLISDNIENEDPVLKYLYDNLKLNYNFYNGVENIEIVKDLLNIAQYCLDDAYCCKLLATRAREISLRLFDNKETEYSENALGYIAGCHLYISKDLKKALDLFNEVLEIRKELYDPDHPFIASALYNLGVCYMEMEKYEEALKYLHLCLEIRKRIYSPLNNHIRYTLDRIKDCYEKLNDKKNCLKYYREVLKIKKELYKKNHPDKEYKDVFLVRGNDKGRPAWHYILIENEEKYLDLKRLINGSNVDVTKFGKIVKSGWGSYPSKEIIEYLEKKYEI